MIVIVFSTEVLTGDTILIYVYWRQDSTLRFWIDRNDRFPTFLYTSTRVAKEQEHLQYNEIPTLFIYLSLKRYPFGVEPLRISH